MPFRSLLAAAALALTLAAPAAAHTGAAPGFHRTYPVASTLCARVEHGHTPKRLASSADQVKTACQTLRNGYDQARSAYTTAVTPIPGQARATIAQARTACKTARANHDRAACRTARRQGLATLRNLRAQVRDAQRAYLTQVKAARHAFWTTIHSVAGGAGVPADHGTPATPAAPQVPVTA